MPSKSSPDSKCQHHTRLGKTLHQAREAEQRLVAESELAKPDNLEVGESPLKQRIGKGTIIKVTILSVVIVACLGYLAWDILAKGPLMQLLSNRDELVRVMNNFGPWAPFFYVMLQVLQTVVAPIPGQIVGGVGGFLFGHWGILWTTIGSVIGFWLVFLIARRFGRPLIEKIFKKSLVDKFDFIINARGSSLILFAIFLLPGFPDDVVCYIAGLTKTSIKKLMLIAILGRFPTIVVVNFIGAGLGENNLGMVAAVSIIGVIVLGIFTWKREAIMKFLKRNEGKKGQLERSTGNKEDKTKSGTSNKEASKKISAKTDGKSQNSAAD